ncbi:cellulose biosynthesis protein BcsS [Bosea sp. (in: a-proteobacteria)]|uniref:cellulose biosynthesis protein BcsS n=1 Tax=Bosea sp. (in: a-proteobacteria) TaxID=1871050 RepID=UPI002FC6CB9F
MAWGVAERSSRFAGSVLGATPALGSAPAAADSTLHQRSPLSMVIFASLETDRSKSHGAIGFKRAFGQGGLEASGFRLGLKWGGSFEPAERRPTRGRMVKTEAHAMLGYEWRIGDLFLALSAGPELEAVFSETGIRAIFSQRLGGRLQADLWATPFENLLLQANAYAATLDQRFWLRLSPGWKLASGLYLGPEVELYRQRDYHKLRLGLHLTGLRLFGLSWRIAAGAQQTSDQPSAAYATLGVYWLR